MTIDLDISHHADIFSEVLNDCPSGIMVTDISGVIKNMNLKILEISGYDFEELAETDIDILTHHQHSEKSLRNLVNKSSTYLKWDGYIQIRKKCGDLTAQKIRMVHRSSTNHNEKYLVFYFIPNLIADDKNQNSEVLISLGRMAAYLSHEIKTPLTAIKMNVDMISRDINLPVSRVRSIQIIKNEISRLERLSKDVLYFSRSTCNSNCSFRLSDSLDEICSLLFPQLSEQNISLRNKLSPDTFVFGDKHSIKSMLMYLIENSIESIKRNGIVELWEEKTVKGNSIIIFIRDTGEGIKEPENIFNLFFTSKSAGTGLGLSIVKKIVEDHSGSIDITSCEPGNTIFKITLPQGAN